jgi:predicted nucleotidyltransferase
MPRKSTNSVKIKYPPSEKTLINLLEEHIQGLIEVVPSIKKVILYGSYARKNPHYGSDVDLLFIVNKRTKNDFEIIYERLFDISFDYEWSPIIITKERFRELKQDDTPFIQKILKEGIRLWP